MQKAIELRPDYPEALNNLGVLFVRDQDYAKAEEQFKSCIRLSPSFDQSYLNLARLYVMQNDKEKAKEALQDLLRVQPENPNAKQAMEMLSTCLNLPFVASRCKLCLYNRNLMILPRRRFLGSSLCLCLAAH